MQKVKPNTAKGYLSSLRSFHIENGLSTSIFNDPRIDLVIRGGKRVHGEGKRRIRFPLTYDILLKIIREVGRDLDGVNIECAICVAFAGFLRCGEFTWTSWDPHTSSQHFLSRKHVKFHTNGSVTLTLPTSKTDPYRTGTAIQLAPSISPLCPVKALTKLFHLQPKDENDPLFSRSISGPFNRQFFIDKIKELLLQAGISTYGFSGHSIRKGAAVSAAANGISKDNIKLLGRWKSDAVDVYINELSEHDQINRNLQLNAKLHDTFNPRKQHTTTISHSTSSTLPWPRQF
jgi:hypothetical protein